MTQSVRAIEGRPGARWTLGVLAAGSRVIDIALDAGFGDISNFNRSFRAEFGAAPQGYVRRGDRI